MQFERIVRDLAQLNVNLYDFALYQNGEIQSHRFQPCNRCNNSYSVAKVFVVTALGLLWDGKKLDLHCPLSAYFAQEFARYAPDPLWREATVEHAIQHRIGFDQGFLDIDVEDASQYPGDDYLALVLQHPLAHRPGMHAQYSDAAYYLLARLVENVAGVPLDDLLMRRLLAPLGFREAAWSRCPRQHPIGATGLYVSAADMVKIGALYAQGGVWRGQRYLSSAWVRTVIENEYELHLQNDRGLYAKGGMYGQGLAFSSAQGWAAAWHAHEEDPLKKGRVMAYLKEME